MINDLQFLFLERIWERGEKVDFGTAGFIEQVGWIFSNCIYKHYGVCWLLSSRLLVLLKFFLKEYKFFEFYIRWIPLCKRRLVTCMDLIGKFFLAQAAKEARACKSASQPSHTSMRADVFARLHVCMHGQEQKGKENRSHPRVHQGTTYSSNSTRFRKASRNSNFCQASFGFLIHAKFVTAPLIFRCNLSHSRLELLMRA